MTYKLEGLQQLQYMKHFPIEKWGLSVLKSNALQIKNLCNAI